MKKAGRGVKLVSASSAFRRTFPNSYILNVDASPSCQWVMTFALPPWLLTNTVNIWLQIHCNNSYAAGKSKDQRRKFQSHPSSEVYSRTACSATRQLPHFTIVVTLSLYWRLCDSSSIFQGVDTNFEGGGGRGGCRLPTAPRAVYFKFHLSVSALVFNFQQFFDIYMALVSMHKHIFAVCA